MRLVFKNQYERIGAKTAAKLMSYLYCSDDWVEKANQLQKVALKAVTKAGVVTFDYGTLYVDTDNDTYKDIRKIADSTDLTNKQKLILLTERYNKYLKEVEGEFGSDLKQELDRAARVKLSSIIAINAPSFIVSGVDEVPIVTHKSLLAGFDESEYRYHAIENRSLQSIKQSGVSVFVVRHVNKAHNCWKIRKQCINQQLMICMEKTIKILTIVGAIVAGIGEILRQFNIASERERLRENTKK